MLELIETGIAVAVLASIAYTAATTFARTKISKALMDEEKVCQNITIDYTNTLLVLGDSTGAGIGADKPEDTIAARLAAHIGATYLENHATSGAAVADLTTQIQKMELSHYDTVLIQIGGNDVIQFHDAKKTAAALEKILDTLPDTGRIILMMAGNVGAATIFPFFIRPFHTWRTRQFHAAFTKLAKKRGIIYVNLYRKPSEDPFLKDPRRYLAADGLHPSSEGYELWFEEVEAALAA